MVQAVRISVLIHYVKVFVILVPNVFPFHVLLWDEMVTEVLPLLSGPGMVLAVAISGL